MHLNKGLLLGLLLPTQLMAWSGINFSIGDESIPIISSNEEFTLTPFKLHLSVEDKTSQGLRVGASIAKAGVKIDGHSIKIDTASDSIGLYLSFPYQLNNVIGLTSRLTLLKSSARPNGDTKGEVDYLAKKLSLGLSIKWQNIRITPTINAISLSGDFKESNDSTALSFTEKQSIYSTLHMDYFAEKNSYIRLSISEHSDNTFSLSFITLY